MTKEYQTGDIAVFRINWLSQTGEEATITGNPLINIKRYDPAGDAWTDIISTGSMTQDSGSKWFYELDTSALTVGCDYITDYSATVDSLSVEATENWRLVNIKDDILDEIKELRKGNEKIEFHYNGSQLGSMTIYTKADDASDWTSPTSTKTLYFTYSGSVLQSVGEQ